MKETTYLIGLMMPYTKRGDLDMNTQEFKDFVKREQSFAKATEGFQEHIVNWRNNEPEEFIEAFQTSDLSILSTKIEKVCLVINYRFDEPIEYIQTTLIVLSNNKRLARYHYLQKLDGTEIDDGFDFL